jgi:hypothetical protein
LQKPAVTQCMAIRDLLLFYVDVAVHVVAPLLLLNILLSILFCCRVCKNFFFAVVFRLSEAFSCFWFCLV